VLAGALQQHHSNTKVFENKHAAVTKQVSNVRMGYAAAV